MLHAEVLVNEFQLFLQQETKELMERAIQGILIVLVNRELLKMLLQLEQLIQMMIQ